MNFIAINLMRCRKLSEVKELQASLVARIVKDLPTMQKTQVQSLSQEGPLEKQMATHCSIPAWRILWTKEPVRLQSMGLKTAGHD